MVNGRSCCIDGRGGVVLFSWRAICQCLRELFGQEGPAQSGGQQSQSNTSQAPSVSMDKQQAAEILGVAKDADVEEIKLGPQALNAEVAP